MSVITDSPLKQEIHERLSCGFYQIPADCYIFSIIHYKSGFVKIGNVFHIDDAPTAAQKKPLILSKRCRKLPKGLTGGKLFLICGMNMYHMAKMFGIGNISKPQAYPCSINLDIEIFVRLGNTG